ncbi:hypothetical protein T492DRAFT_835283 [Pavlovales sp. CCMP2436]|nr:hypothetical protein T492DRAFT_835283 [Pavlovales sp. CCMP2436]
MLWGAVIEQWAEALKLVVAADLCHSILGATVVERIGTDPSFAKNLAVGLEERVGDTGALAEAAFYSKAGCARAAFEATGVEGREKVHCIHRAGGTVPVCDACYRNRVTLAVTSKRPLVDAAALRASATDPRTTDRVKRQKHDAQQLRKETKRRGTELVFGSAEAKEVHAALAAARARLKRRDAGTLLPGVLVRPLTDDEYAHINAPEQAETRWRQKNNTMNRGIRWCMPTLHKCFLLRSRGPTSFEATMQSGMMVGPSASRLRQVFTLDDARVKTVTAHLRKRGGQWTWVVLNRDELKVEGGTRLPPAIGLLSYTLLLLFLRMGLNRWLVMRRRNGGSWAIIGIAGGIYAADAQGGDTQPKFANSCLIYGSRRSFDIAAYPLKDLNAAKLLAIDHAVIAQLWMECGLWVAGVSAEGAPDNRSAHQTAILGLGAGAHGNASTFKTAEMKHPVGRRSKLGGRRKFRIFAGPTHNEKKWLSQIHASWLRPLLKKKKSGKASKEKRHRLMKRKGKAIVWDTILALREYSKGMLSPYYNKINQEAGERINLASMRVPISRAIMCRTLTLLMLVDHAQELAVDERVERVVNEDAEGDAEQRPQRGHRLGAVEDVGARLDQDGRGPLAAAHEAAQALLERDGKAHCALAEASRDATLEHPLPLQLAPIRPAVHLLDRRVEHGAADVCLRLQLLRHHQRRQRQSPHSLCTKSSARDSLAPMRSRLTRSASGHVISSRHRTVFSGMPRLSEIVSTRVGVVTSTLASSSVRKNATSSAPRRCARLTTFGAHVRSHRFSTTAFAMAPPSSSAQIRSSMSFATEAASTVAVREIDAATSSTGAAGGLAPVATLSTFATAVDAAAVAAKRCCSTFERALKASCSASFGSGVLPDPARSAAKSVSFPWPCAFAGFAGAAVLLTGLAACLAALRRTKRRPQSSRSSSTVVAWPALPSSLSSSSTAADRRASSPSDHQTMMALHCRLRIFPAGGGAPFTSLRTVVFTRIALT